MSISREARILIGILILAAGAWLWINFFMQGGLDTTFSFFADESPSAPQALTETSEVPPAPAPAELPTLQAAQDAPASPGEGPSLAPGLEVDFGDGAPQLAQEVSLIELPFLITAPPAEVVEDEPVEPVEAARPTPTERITVNPFTPLVLPEPTPTEVVETPEPTPTVAEPTPAPTTPAPTTPPAVSPAPAEPPVVRAPAPQVSAPPSAPPVRDLPRALPSATLPVAPALLRTPRSPEDALPDLTDLPQRATVRVPDAPTTTLIERDPPALAEAVRDPEPRRLEDPGPADPSAPRVAGLSPLSRYLRDNDVSFTGAVMGPVGVGIFRSAGRTTPFTVPLGQTLPDTDIVLTDLQGQQAELSQHGDREILILESRR